MSQLQSLLKLRFAPQPQPNWSRLTVRLDDERHEKLKIMARKMSLSKSAASEEILSSAIDDAWLVFCEKFDDEPFCSAEQDLQRAVGIAKLVRDGKIELDEDGQLVPDGQRGPDPVEREEMMRGSAS